jgi:eukaryotic-like serine/threonine-protein kinase
MDSFAREDGSARPPVMESQPTSPTARLPRRPRTPGRPLADRESPWILAGRYRMDEVIGRGGMSTVYRATDTVLDRPVAVKVLLDALAAGDPTHVERFRREARAVAALHHPGVVKIYDTGADEARHFLVMELVDGRGLDAVLRERGTLQPREAVRIGARVADALAAAHAAGILHRDVKPANVMLTDDGEVKVLDFGIARPLQEATLTQPAMAMGTAAYMSPERVRGEPGDARSDIYALGCVLYAMLTGQAPFAAGDHVALLHQQVNAEPVPPRVRGVGIGAGLEVLVLAMLAKDPSARPQTAAEVAGRLRASLLDELDSTAATRRQVLAARGAPATVPLPSRRLIPLGLLAALVLLVAVVIALSSGGGAGSPKPAVASGVVHRSAIGSYHEPASSTTSQAATTSSAQMPAASARPPAHGPKPIRAHGRGPGGSGPPGHDRGGPPGHDGGH